MVYIAPSPFHLLVRKSRPIAPQVRLGREPLDLPFLPSIDLAFTSSRLLKSDPTTQRIPVLLVTAHAMRGDRERFLEESGADDYISEPIPSYRILVEKVNDLLASQEVGDGQVFPGTPSPA